MSDQLEPFAVRQTRAAILFETIRRDSNARALASGQLSGPAFAAAEASKRWAEKKIARLEKQLREAL